MPLLRHGAAVPNWPSVMQGLLEGIENKVCLGRLRDPPAHDAIGECVDDEGHINKALPSRHIGEVADPKQVRLTSQKDDVTGEVTLGGTYNWSDDKYSVFGQVSAAT